MSYGYWNPQQEAGGKILENLQILFLSPNSGSSAYTEGHHWGSFYNSRGWLVMTTRPSVGIEGLQGLGLAQAEIRHMEEISQSQYSKENKNIHKKINILNNFWV